MHYFRENSRIRKKYFIPVTNATTGKFKLTLLTNLSPETVKSTKSASLLPLLKQFKNFAVDIDCCMSELFSLNSHGQKSNCDCELEDPLEFRVVVLR